MATEPAHHGINPDGQQTLTFPIEKLAKTENKKEFENAFF